MAILEEIVKKLLKTGQDTGRKARDVADVITLNADISGSQSRLRDLQTELGLFMAESVFTDLDRESLQKLLEEDVPERTFTVRNWKEMYEKLLYLRSEEEVIAMAARKISKIRGEKVCPVCGEYVAPESKFCPQCGTRFAEEKPAEEAHAEEAPADVTEPAPEAKTAEPAPAEPAQPDVPEKQEEEKAPE